MHSVFTKLIQENESFLLGEGVVNELTHYCRVEIAKAKEQVKDFRKLISSQPYSASECVGHLQEALIRAHANETMLDLLETHGLVLAIDYMLGCMSDRALRHGQGNRDKAETRNLDAKYWAKIYEEANRVIDLALHERKKPKTLADHLPGEFMGCEYEGTEARDLHNIYVLAKIDGCQPGKAWPGPHKNVLNWYILKDGHAVGFNENPSTGWSFPVINLSGSSLMHYLNTNNLLK